MYITCYVVTGIPGRCDNIIWRLHRGSGHHVAEVPLSISTVARRRRGNVVRVCGAPVTRARTRLRLSFVTRQPYARDDDAFCAPVLQLGPYSHRFYECNFFFCFFTCRFFFRSFTGFFFFFAGRQLSLLSLLLLYYVLYCYIVVVIAHIPVFRLHNIVTPVA